MSDQPTPAPLLPWRPIDQAPTIHGTKIVLCQDGQIRERIKYQAHGNDGWFNELGHRVRIGKADMFVILTPPAEGMEVRERFTASDGQSMHPLFNTEAEAQAVADLWRRSGGRASARVCRVTVITQPLDETPGKEVQP